MGLERVLPALPYTVAMHLACAREFDPTVSGSDAGRNLGLPVHQDAHEACNIYEDLSDCFLGEACR